MPLFALLAPGMLAVVGLGLDGARLFLERRDAQGAADLAALAGARSLPDNHGQATSDAIAVAMANGYGASQLMISFPDPGSITVSIDVPVAMTFLTVVGIEDMPVGASATAVHEEEVVGAFETGVPVLMAHQKACGEDQYADQALKVNGTNVYAAGHVISNAGGKWNGNGGTVDGDLTYVQTPPMPCAQGNVFDVIGTPPVSPQAIGTHTEYPEPYNSLTPATACAPEPGKIVHDLDGIPVEFDDDYVDISDPGLGFINPSTRQLLDGVYCQGPGKGIKITRIGTWGNVTLVADFIALQAKNINLNPHWNALTAYAYGSGMGSQISSQSFTWSGSDGEWTGLLFAPHSEVQVAAARTHTQLGAIWGENVHFNGSQTILRNDGILGTVMSRPEKLALIE